MNARRAPLRAALAAAALAASAAAAQELTLGAGPEPGGTVVGRVCVDRDGDGRCGDDEPGVAGTRLLAEGGQVALADADGRFHLLEVPGRALFADRVAWGGHALSLEALGQRRGFELAPFGAARVDLAVPPPAHAPPPPLAGAAAPPGSDRGPARAADGRLAFALGGRTAPGAAVALGAARATAGADGLFAAEALLARGENALPVAVLAPGGAGSVWLWPVVLAPRRAGGDLVAPAEPVRLAELDVEAHPGGALVAGRLAPGRRVRVGGVEARAAPDGTFAAFAPAASPVLEILDDGGAPVAVTALPLAPAAGVTAVAALAEVEISVLGDPGLLVTGRGAAATRARLGPVDVEAGIDLDDRDRHASLADLVRPREGLVREHALDPDRSLAATGDEAAADDRNPARGRLWARVEAPGARLDVGGARAALGKGELGRYERAIFGASARGEGDAGPLRLRAAAFGATLREDAGGNAPPAAAHDVLAATGGAALWLAHGAVVPGSEALRIEWRDPVTGRLSGERRLARGVDYEIDWVSGRVVLAAPLASVGPSSTIVTAAPLAAAAQAVVVADYLAASAGPAAEDLQGGGASAAWGPLSASAHVAREDRPGDAYRLSSGAVVLDLGAPLRLSAEVARSSGSPFAVGGAARSTDGGYVHGAVATSAGSADAVHLEARAAAGPVSAEAWWRERDVGYADAEFQEPAAPSATAAPSSRERGAAVTAEAGRLSGTVIAAGRRGYALDDPAGGRWQETQTLVARAGLSAARGSFFAEGVQAERSGTDAGTATSAGARAAWRVDPALTLDLSHHQGLRRTGAARDPTFTAAGLALAQRDASFSVRGGWGPGLGPQLVLSGERSRAGDAVYGTFTADPDAPDVLGGGAAASALGARRVAGGAEVYTEEQLGRDAFGLRAARVFGLALSPTSGLRVSVSGERGERLRLDGTRTDRSAAAAAVGLVAGPVRAALRGELRREGADDHAAAGGSVEWAAARGATLSARASLVTGTVDGREALGLDASIAGGLRRAAASALASLSRLADQRPGEARRDAVIARLAATAAAGRRVELGLGAALAWQEVGGGRDDRIAASARARVAVAGPLDAALEYARRAPLSGGDLGALDALRVEVGAAAGESRLALGYTLVGFGGDGLAPAADTGRLYLRAQLTY